MRINFSKLGLSVLFLIPAAGLYWGGGRQESGRQNPDALESRVAMITRQPGAPAGPGLRRATLFGHGDPTPNHADDLPPGLCQMAFDRGLFGRPDFGEWRSFLRGEFAVRTEEGSVVELMRRLPGGGVRDAALEALGAVLHERDFGDGDSNLQGLDGSAMEWCTSLDHAGLVPPAILVTMASSKFSSPFEALVWLDASGFPAEAAKEGFVSAFGMALEEDPTKAWQWLSGRSAESPSWGELQDLLAERLIYHVMDNPAIQPAVLLQILEAITAPEVAERVGRRLRLLGVSL